MLCLQACKVITAGLGINMLDDEEEVRVVAAYNQHKNEIDKWASSKIMEVSQLYSFAIFLTNTQNRRLTFQ